MKNGVIVQINEIATMSKKVVVVGQQFSKIDNLYIIPCPSSLVGVYKVSELSSKVELWQIDEIDKKVLMIPLKTEGNCYAAMSLLHGKSGVV